MAHQVSEAELAKLRNSFRRCSNETIEAIVSFRQTGDASFIPVIVYGIIQRYIPSGKSTDISRLGDDTRLIEDLEIDSLTMLEVVLSVEEALQIRIENEELTQILTLGEVKKFVAEKISSGDDKDEDASQSSKRLSRDEILLALPHQDPFLFLDSAEIVGETIYAKYHITGEEYFLAGHFKDDPVFPASIAFEALGQAGCLWVLSKVHEKIGTLVDSKHVLFGSMDQAHFYRKARPGDTLEFEVNLSRLREPLAIFNGKVSCGGNKVASVNELVIVFGEAANSDKVQKEEAPADDDLPQV